MDLLERVEQLEQELKQLRPDLHFPSTATLEQRLRWLEVVLEEMRAKDNHGVYAETPTEEKLRKLLQQTVYIKGDRVTLHSMTADPASCVTGDMWFRSDLGKSKLAIDSVVANAKLLRREGDVLSTAEIPNLAASKITSERFGMARMPDMALNKIMVGQGAGNSPVEQDKPAGVTDSTAGDYFIASRDPQVITYSETYVKAKEAKVGRGGTFRIKFDFKQGAAHDTPAYTRIYRNGVAVGTERSDTTGTYVTYSEDISGWSKDDLLQIYAKKGNYSAMVQNFRIYSGNPVDVACSAYGE